MSMISDINESFGHCVRGIALAVMTAVGGAVIAPRAAQALTTEDVNKHLENNNYELGINYIVASSDNTRNGDIPYTLRNTWDLGDDYFVTAQISGDKDLLEAGVRALIVNSHNNEVGLMLDINAWRGIEIGIDWEKESKNFTLSAGYRHPINHIFDERGSGGINEVNAGIRHNITENWDVGAEYRGTFSDGLKDGKDQRLALTTTFGLGK